MATKKAAPKKAAKAAAPAKKAPAKKPAPTKNSKPAPKKAAPAPKKAAAPAKKAAPKKAAPAVAKNGKPAPKKAAPPAPKKAAPAAKKAAPPVKKVATPAKKAPVKAVPAKAAPKAAAPKAAAPKAAEPVKKPAVAAPTQKEVKPVIKPLEKPAPKKAEAPKPIVIPKTSTTKAVKYEPDFTKSVLDTKPQGQTGPTMRYSDAELTEFRELIQKKLDSAKKELTYLQGLITRKDESGDLDEGRYMTMEDGSMSMEREQLSQMASRQIQFIDHLEKAIMRIENKTYGICRVTGKLIDKARLRAVPHATLSIEAKQMMNK
jgi:RNA polymerase-binding transcription factor DksA